ncbi:MAG: hypothetical protein JNL98_38780, partial [Bryobacterales bacterium]|nr:hypothetical protein [Bryobacterales bacterium]
MPATLPGFAPANEPAPGGKLLHVYLHGLVTLVETTDEFRAYLVSMSGEHRYLAGTWLAEREIPSGATGVLKGVAAGAATLNPRDNPVLRINELPSPNHTHVRAFLTLPKPRAIYYLNRGTIDITGGNKDRLL